MNHSSSLSIPPSISGRQAIEVAIDSVHKAEDIVMDRFNTTKDFSFKGRANVVTEVDLLSEKSIIDALHQEYPYFRIKSEESGSSETESPYEWIVDPIDGTRNYLSGIPHFSITLALAYKGEIIIGVTYDPIRKELFQAQKGGGAYLNKEPISISNHTEINQSVVGFDMGYSDKRASQGLEVAQKLWPGIQSIRVMGSAALGIAYAACGRIDLYFHHHLAVWDIAAGMLLVKEAGGIVVDRKGNETTQENDSIIASNPILIQSFLNLTDGLDWRK